MTCLVAADVAEGGGSCASGLCVAGPSTTLAVFATNRLFLKQLRKSEYDVAACDRTKTISASTGFSVPALH